MPAPEKAYVVRDVRVCLHCGSGRGTHYVVVAPDGDEIGREFDERWDAEEFAEALNGAYERGRDDAADK